VDFFYDPRLDDYSGVLLYDLGDQDGFVQHARYVAAKLKRKRHQEADYRGPAYHLCLENTLSQIYGGTLRGPHLFRTAESDVEKRPQKDRACMIPAFTDAISSCPMCRVKVLSSVDIECAPVRNAGLFTNCCGGPAESISPKLSKAVGQRRIAELEKYDEPIVAMCPICLGNLRKAGAAVQDLSTVLAHQAA
jgi:hypothetical protein